MHAVAIGIFRPGTPGPLLASCELPSHQPDHEREEDPAGEVSVPDEPAHEAQHRKKPEGGDVASHEPLHRLDSSPSIPPPLAAFPAPTGGPGSPASPGRGLGWNAPRAHRSTPSRDEREGALAALTCVGRCRGHDTWRHGTGGRAYDARALRDDNRYGAESSVPRAGNRIQVTRAPSTSGRRLAGFRVRRS